jgi:PAS domain S-box-containing protein
MKYIVWLFVLAGFVVFFIDSSIPLGYAPWFLYIFLLFIYLHYSDKKHIIYLAAFYIFLIIPGYFFSPSIAADKMMPITNRTMGIIMLTFLAVLGLKEEAAKKISSEVLERVKDLFFAIDQKLKIVFINKSAKEFVGTEEDVVGKDIIDVIPNHDNVVLKKKIQEAFLAQKPLNFELDLSNSEKYLDVSIYTSKHGLSVFAKDITERVLAEKKLAKLLQEKELMIREIQHRTKNNFQLVMSLINLQIHSVQDELAKKILDQTRSRISSITLLYDRLFGSGGYFQVDLSVFIADIINNMQNAANHGSIKMENDLNLESAWVKIENAIPLGLIINELYTNSLKYAFNDNHTGKVKLEMKFLTDNHLHIKYCDSGKGLPDGFDIERDGGHGSSIILAFVNQLDGTLQYRNNNGAEFEMKLKVKKVNNEEEQIVTSLPAN